MPLPTGVPVEIPNMTAMKLFLLARDIFSFIAKAKYRLNHLYKGQQNNSRWVKMKDALGL